ncbi:MAG TPA: GAF domain-containing protein [Terriglobales bacterium]|nr:GAF domain-containing protein [Terriglobales bacterium]
MSYPINGYLQLLIFGTFIILVLKFEQKYFKFYPGVKWTLALGIFLLFCGAFLTFFLPSNKPLMVADSDIKTSAEAGLYILGSIFIFSGLRRWFWHLARVKENSFQRLKRLSCLKQVQSLSQNNQDLEQNLKEAFNKAMQFMGYQKGVFFRSTQNSQGMLLLSYSNLTPEELSRIYQLNLSQGFLGEALKAKEILTQNKSQGSDGWSKLFQEKEKICSFACVPIRHNSRLFGLICIYDSDPERFAFEEVQFLTSLRDELGLIVEQSLLSEKAKDRKKGLQTADEVARLLLESKNIEDDLPALSQIFKKVFEFDYLSLSLIEGSGKNVKKISLGTGENLLLDVKPNLPVYGTSIGWVIDSGEPLVETDLEKRGLYEDDLSNLLKIRSKIIVPLKVKGNVAGTLTLGSRKPNLYNQKYAKRMSLFSSLFSLHLQQKSLRESLSQEQKYFQTFSRHFLEFLNHKDFKSYLDGLTEDLTQVLPTSFCRVSFLDFEKKALETFSSYKRREEISLSPYNSQPLEALPWHRLALETGKPMLINQDDPESTISSEEAKLSLAPGVKSALLLPLLNKEQIVGMVSLGEMRSWERRPIRKKEIDFMEKIATEISLAHNYSQSGEIFPSSRVPQADREWSSLGLQVNNSLTSIIGSVELLNLKRDLSEEKKDRYLQIIEKGALRIKENMERFFDQPDSVTIEK